MKKALCILLAVLMIMSLTACDAEKQEAGAEEGFKPALDTSVRCHISVAGGYSNFEALEAEFDRFNEYYPNAELVYTKIDDYNNMIGTVLNGNDAPDIYVNYSGTDGSSINPRSIMPRISPIPRWAWIWAASAAISF